MARSHDGVANRRASEHTVAINQSRYEMPGVALTHALRAFVRHKMNDRADGDDLIQETYARLLNYQATSPVHNIKALCFAIARNLLLDYQRSARRISGGPLDETMVCPQPTAEVVVAYRRAVAIMAETVGKMPPLRREVFLRKRLDGLSTVEIADSLDMSSTAVEKHVVRALHDLRSALGRRGFTMEGGA